MCWLNLHYLYFAVRTLNCYNNIGVKQLLKLHYLKEMQKQDDFSFKYWTIKVQRGSILKSHEMENLQSTLGFPPPEMTFGNNYISIEYKNQPVVGFFTEDALKMVGTKPEDVMQVSFAKDWAKSRIKPGEEYPVIYPFDWTYYTDYQGTIQRPNAKFIETDQVIPVQKILNAGQNLWFNEIILFEDELADNGKSMFDVRARVVQGHLILLARLVVRLDKVNVRLNETRIYIDLLNDFLLKDCRKKQSTYDKIIKQIPVGGDKAALLDDNNWLSERLDTVDHKIYKLNF